MVATLTMFARPAAHPPQVQLEVLGWVDATPFEIDRLDGDGRWRPVRTAEPGTSSSGIWTGYDVEAPYGVRVEYRLHEAGVLSGFVTGMTVEIEPTGEGFVPGEFTDEFVWSDGSPGVPALPGVVLDVDVPWLVHPGVPDLSVPLPIIRALSPRSRAANRGAFRVLGRAAPVVVSGLRSAATYTMVVGTETHLQRQAMDSVLDDGAVLLLNMPAGNGWGVPTEYVSVDSLDESRLWQYGPDPKRDWTLPLTVVDRPVGGQSAQWSWGALLAEQATWADVLAAYPSWRAVLYHQPS